MKLKTGRGFTQALESRRALSVRDAPVRSVLQQLQEQAGLCIIVDRRINPSQRMTLSTGLVPTKDLLRKVAAELPNAAVSVNRAFVYIGPTPTAGRLRTLCEQNRSIILDARRQFGKETYGKLSAAEPLAWSDLESPRDVLASLATRAGVSVVNLDVVPHDLWHARRISRMPFAESMTMFLSHFDLTFTINPDTAECKIVTMPDVVLLKRYHRISRQRHEKAERQLSRRFPYLDVTWERSGVQLSATYEQHEQIEALLSSESRFSDD